ncbi:MAG: hypothetical protein ABFC18_06165 [Rikenellaceae bacterium]
MALNFKTKLKRQNNDYNMGFIGCLPFVFFVNSIRVLGVARTNFFSSLIPAVSAAGAYMLGQEGMSYTKAIGIVVVIIGVIIAQRDKKSNLT